MIFCFTGKLILYQEGTNKFRYITFIIAHKNDISAPKGFVFMNKNTHRLDGIICDAEKCAYNENHECHATSIQVESGNATKANQTECSTFKNKCETC